MVQLQINTDKKILEAIRKITENYFKKKTQTLDFTVDNRTESKQIFREQYFAGNVF